MKRSEFIKRMAAVMGVLPLIGGVIHAMGKPESISKLKWPKPVPRVGDGHYPTMHQAEEANAIINYLDSDNKEHSIRVHLPIIKQ